MSYTQEKLNIYRGIDFDEPDEDGKVTPSPDKSELKVHMDTLSTNSISSRMRHSSEILQND